MSFPLDAPISIPLTTLPSHECNYLPGRMASSRAFRIERLPGEIYHDFMDAGFRRSGQIIYQPTCVDCQKCVPIRVLVDRFVPSKSQRRVLRRNSDLAVTIAKPKLDAERANLYGRYVSNWHDRIEADGAESLEQFLYCSPVTTLEFCYRTPTGKLVGVGIADVCSRSFSSVYFYFDPDQSVRSLGTFSAVYEIQFCQRMSVPFYYMGFWVNGCREMQYKSRFQPAQLLDSDGSWKDYPGIADDLNCSGV